MRYQAALRPDNWYSNPMKVPLWGRSELFPSGGENPVTMTQRPTTTLTWLQPGDPFPPIETAWGEMDGAPGLLAAGGALDVPTLIAAYSHGIFPWFSEGQPILWWSTNPRMVLRLENFKLHRSLRQAIKRFAKNATCEIRIDSAFATVIEACAQVSRNGEPGTWILPPMVKAYTDLHRVNKAHSVETWIDGQLVGGLYCVALGQAVFGESMFALQTDASKIALAALVAICKRAGIQMIDCQQNTAHLASLGAREIHRSDFVAHVAAVRDATAPTWKFEPLYWNELLAD
jgi:leucyl/phenylalanyl-tRNA--protein transferase